MPFTPESNFNAFAYFGSHYNDYEPDTALLIESLLNATMRYDLRTDAYYMQRLCRYYLGSDYSINLFITYMLHNQDLFSPDSLSVCTVTDPAGTTDLDSKFDLFMHLIGRDATFACMYAALQNYRSTGVLDFESMYAKPPFEPILARREAINESLETLVSLHFEEQFMLKCVPIDQKLDRIHAIIGTGLSLFQWAIRTPKSYLYVLEKCEKDFFYLDPSEPMLLFKYLLNLVHYYAPSQMSERDRSALEIRLQDYYNYNYYRERPWDLKELHELPLVADLGVELDVVTDLNTSMQTSAITLNSEACKLDFIRVLYVLYDLNFFVKETGKKVTKKDFFAFLATWLGNETLAHYDKDMTNSWKSDMSAHVAIFDKMRSKMVELATKKGVPNYKQVD